MEVSLSPRACLLAAAVLLAVTVPVAAAPATPTEDAALRHARQLLRKVPLVDGHNDLPDEIREQVGGDLAKLDLRARGTKGDTDIPRLREGLLSGQFWSVWIASGLPHPAR